MVVEPWHWVEAYVSAGCDRVIVHAEADPHPHRTLSVIRQAGAEAGVALNPSSSRAIVSHILDLIDMVVVMTVNPGFGGQRYLDTMEPKIGKIREMIGEREIALEVDGGIKPGTITRAHAAGADRFISGSGILGHPGGKKDAVEGLRSALYVEKVLASR
jgi:ribulose-phosphate 3-epimerase